MGETCLRSTPFLFLSSSTEIAWGIRVPWRTWAACRLVATTTGVHLFKVDKVISHFSYLCFLISHVTELCVFFGVFYYPFWDFRGNQDALRGTRSQG